MSESHAMQFLAEFSRDDFPGTLLDRYDPIELLSQNDHSQTFLLKEKSSGKQVIAKRYDAAGGPAGESAMLSLCHPGLPAFLEKIEDQDGVYILREYMPGLSLEQYAQMPLQQKEAVHIMCGLCDILAYLHRQSPPVIHRDIKPSNIILEPETGKVSLIDFSIAREYDRGARNDTVCMGTQQFSPPEQYGFAQTDNRADIYALGVVLCWLLTGDSHVADGMQSVSAAGLCKIIRRCTAFDPAKRYSNVMHLKRDLLVFDKQVKRRAFIAIAAVCAALALLFAGYIAGRYTKMSLSVLDSILESNEVIAFGDALLEERVRAGMNRPEGTITAAQARTVTHLDLSASDPGVPDREKIKDIGALAYFHGLRFLYLDWNDISDIAPLAGLTKLEALFLGGNENITDFTPLAGLVNMKEIRLIGCRVSSANVQALAGMAKLESLWVESSRLKDIGFVKHFPSLSRLELKNCSISDISPLADLVHLTDLGLEQNPIRDVTPLLALPNLTYVSLSGDMRPMAQEQLTDALFDIAYR